MSFVSFVFSCAEKFRELDLNREKSQEQEVLSMLSQSRMQQ